MHILSTEAFQSLPAIKELQLSLNGIVNIDIMDKSFEFLSILDLSYNYLSETSITDLGRLPQLTELHLTGIAFSYNVVTNLVLYFRK